MLVRSYKLCLWLGCALLASSASAATLGTYDFTAGTTSASSPATGVSFGSFGVGPGGVRQTSANTFLATGFNAPDAGPAIAAGDYVNFSVTPQAGYEYSLTSIGYTYTPATGGNPRGRLQSSRSGFGPGLHIGSITAGTGQNVNVAAHVDLRDATELRIYLYGSDSASKQHRLDNIAVRGETRARASLAASNSTPDARRVFTGTAGVNHSVAVTNDALAAGTQATRVLDYTLGVAGAGLTTATSGGSLASGASANATVDVDTSSAGLKQGAVNVSSTDVWRAGGVAGASSVAVDLAAVEVLDHADAEFGTGGDALTIDFGTLSLGAGLQTRGFSLLNLLSSAGFTAGLDLDSITGSGDTGVLSTSLQGFTNLAAGSSAVFEAYMNATTAGSFSATYSLLLSDEDGIEGDSSEQELTLTLRGAFAAQPTGTIAGAASAPEPSTLLMLAGLSLLGLGRRMQRRR